MLADQPPTTPYLSPNSVSSLRAVGESGEEGVFPAWTGSLLSVLLSQLQGDKKNIDIKVLIKTEL